MKAFIIDHNKATTFNCRLKKKQENRKQYLRNREKGEKKKKKKLKKQAMKRKTHKLKLPSLACTGLNNTILISLRNMKTSKFGLHWPGNTSRFHTSETAENSELLNSNPNEIIQNPKITTPKENHTL